MARQAGTEITGVFGRTHYYKWKGVYYMRTVPLKEKMSKKTLEQAGIFGQASRLSARFRKILDQVIATPKSRRTMHRFNHALARWLRSDPINQLQNGPSYITGYEFNEECELKNLLKIPLIINENESAGMVLKIPPLNPALDIIAPEGTKIILWNIIIAACSEKEGISNSYTTKLVMAFDDEMLDEQEIILPLDVLPGSFIIVAASLNYSITGDRSGIIHDIKWKPGSIIHGSARKL